MAASAVRRPARIAPGLALVSRFAAAGVINTLVGASVTLGLDLGLGVQPALANAAGYALGVLVSWVLQRRYVFRSRQARWRDRAKFLAVVAASFLANQLVLAALHAALGQSVAARGAAQLLAMATYTTLQFLLLRFWVFPAAGSAASGVEEV